VVQIFLSSAKDALVDGQHKVVRQAIAMRRSLNHGAADGCHFARILSRKQVCVSERGSSSAGKFVSRLLATCICFFVFASNEDRNGSRAVHNKQLPTLGVPLT
jgi:hypothetical protein